MYVITFRTKREKEDLLEKARKMEEYAGMIVDCIEKCNEDDDEYSERGYHEEPEYERRNMRYAYRRMR